METTKTIGEFVRESVNELATSYIKGMTEIIGCYHQCTIKCFTCPHYSREHRDHLKDKVFCYDVECPEQIPITYSPNIIKPLDITESD